jgi:hypothetical protein
VPCSRVNVYCYNNFCGQYCTIFGLKLSEPAGNPDYRQILLSLSVCSVLITSPQGRDYVLRTVQHTPVPARLPFLNYVTLKIDASRAFETSGTVTPNTRRHIPKEMNLQQRYCAKLKSRTQYVSLWLPTVSCLQLSVCPACYCICVSLMHSDILSVSTCQHRAAAGTVSKQRGYELSSSIADSDRDFWTAHYCGLLLRLTNNCRKY